MLRCRPLLSRQCCRSVALRPFASGLSRASHAQIRQISTEPASDSDVSSSGKPSLLFEGTKASMVTTMKRVSIGNLSFAVTASPLLLYATQIAGAPGSGVAMSCLLLAFGGGTTAGLTYITKVRSAHPHPLPRIHMCMCACSLGCCCCRRHTSSGLCRSRAKMR